MSTRPTLAHHSIAGRRPYQEDAILVDTLPDGRVLLAVADGMGGHAAGEVASAEALRALRAGVLDGLALAESFRLANQAVHARSQEPGKTGMGTTLVAVLLDGDAYEAANVGDSRAYLLRPDGIERVTADHSFVAEAIRRGYSEEEATRSPWKDVLTRAIGTEPEVEVDTFGPFLVQGDAVLLLCSDGLYKTLPDGDVRRLYARPDTTDERCQALVSAAHDRGSDDNISVVVAEFGRLAAPELEKTVTLEVADLGPNGHEGGA